jgi:phage baseplate assembly protein gpV
MNLNLDGRQAQIWTAMPCIVTGINLAQMTIEAQPAIQGTYTDQNNVTTQVNLPTLLDVPICFPSAGGFTITFPIAVGNEVLVIIASRCIDAWWQLGAPIVNGIVQTQVAIEARMHDLSDGFAIPGPKSLPNVVSSVSSTDCQIRNDAGTTYVSITAAGKITLVSPTEIDITAPVIALNGAVTAASLAVSGSGAATVAGSLVVTGAVSAQGTDLHTHVHSGVSFGGSDTGPPV